MKKPTLFRIWKERLSYCLYGKNFIRNLRKKCLWEKKQTFWISDANRRDVPDRIKNRFQG